MSVSMNCFKIWQMWMWKMWLLMRVWECLPASCENEWFNRGVVVIDISIPSGRQLLTQTSILRTQDWLAKASYLMLRLNTLILCKPVTEHSNASTSSWCLNLLRPPPPYEPRVVRPRLLRALAWLKSELWEISENDWELMALDRCALFIFQVRISKANAYAPLNESPPVQTFTYGVVFSLQRLYAEGKWLWEYLERYRKDFVMDRWFNSFILCSFPEPRLLQIHWCEVIAILCNLTL